MTGLPEGWAKATIKELVGTDGLFVDGDWVETKDQDPTGEVRLTQLADVGEGRWRDRSRRYMTAAAADRLGCTFLKVNDVLVARMPDPLGRASLFPGDARQCVTVVDVAVVRPGSAGVSPAWLMWAINAPSTRATIEAQQAGTTRKRISRKNLGEIELSIPPRAEQERIVTAIEEAFSKLDAGEAGLRGVHQLLRRLREAVLAAAIDGHLVPQDPADLPATEILADLGVEPDSLTDDLPLGWVPTALGDLLQGIEAGKSFATQGQPARSGEMGVIKVSAMTWGEFRPEENKALPPGTHIEQRWVVRAGDLLLSRANTEEYVGVCVLVPTDHPGLILSDKSLRLVPADGIEPRWLLHALRSRPARVQIEQLATGTKESMRNISQAKLRALRLSLPPTTEQGRIADELERQLSFIEACERAIEIAGERGEALRRSLLKSAFEGRLVPQDPSEEPASDLLRRLRDSNLADAPSRGRKPKSQTALAPS